MSRISPEIRAFPEKEVPLELLLLGDPDRKMVQKYMKTSIYFGAFIQDEVVGIIALNEKRNSEIEIENLSVLPYYQKKKIGRALMEYSIDYSKGKGYKKILIKTGNTSVGQLALFQKLGFELSGINQNHFIQNYSGPIYENHFECRHQVVLEYRIFSEEEVEDEIRKFWKAFIEKNEEHRDSSYEVWSFGLGEYQANSLLGLVRTGVKTGTSSALEMYEEGEKIPESGDLSIVTFGNGMPACIIRTEDVKTLPFEEISRADAALEGEGDCSLEYWREVHHYFFRLEYKGSGLEFTERSPVIFERFKVIFDRNELE
ncbi:MAG: GNAT family N-acetyltransferase [Spirochaetales bacterium]|nr:GNAT family N-acetyltransferase [Spirochaetales bacterium]